MCARAVRGIRLRNVKPPARAPLPSGSMAPGAEHAQLQSVRTASGRSSSVKVPGSVYREADTIVAVPRSVLSRATRLLLSAMHLVGSRTIVIAGLLLAVWTGYGAVRNLWFSLNGTEVTGVVTRQIEEFSADWKGGPPAPVGAEVAGIDLASASRQYRAVVQFGDGGRMFDVVSELRGPARVYRRDRTCRSSTCRAGPSVPGSGPSCRTRGCSPGCCWRRRCSGPAARGCGGGWRGVVHGGAALSRRAGDGRI